MTYVVLAGITETKETADKDVSFVVFLPFLREIQIKDSKEATKVGKTLFLPSSHMKRNHPKKAKEHLLPGGNPVYSSCSYWVLRKWSPHSKWTLNLNFERTGVNKNGELGVFIPVFLK